MMNMNTFSRKSLKTLTLLLGGVCLMTLSCAKEKAVETTDPTLISATLGEVTKISHTDENTKLSLAWETGDALRIISGSNSKV